MQRSGPQLKAALEEIWHTLRGFDFRALMPPQVERDDYAAKAPKSLHEK